MCRPCVLAFLLGILGLCALCYAIKYEDCGSDLGKLVGVSLTGCKRDAVCKLKRGSIVTLEIQFVPNIPIMNITPVAYGVIADVPIAIPLHEPYACNDPDSGIACPLRAHQMYTYKTKFSIQRRFPPVALDLKWQLQNEADDQIICVSITSKIS